jgi:hypothetical protein
MGVDSLSADLGMSASILLVRLKSASRGKRRLSPAIGCGHLYEQRSEALRNTLLTFLGIPKSETSFNHRNTNSSEQEKVIEACEILMIENRTASRRLTELALGIVSVYEIDQQVVCTSISSSSDPKAWATGALRDLVSLRRFGEISSSESSSELFAALVTRRLDDLVDAFLGRSSSSSSSSPSTNAASFSSLRA